MGEQIGMWKDSRQWVINQELREHKCLEEVKVSGSTLSSPSETIKKLLE